MIESEETALSMTSAVFLHPTRNGSVLRHCRHACGWVGRLAHGYGVDLANNPDGRKGTVEYMYSVRQTSLINQDLPVILLVLLFTHQYLGLIRDGQNQRTTIHLLPSSSSSLGGFFASVAGFLPTAGGAFLEISGTGAALRSSGFLCVICDGSTFFKPEVTAPPRFNSERRAAAPPPPTAPEGLEVA